jgi:ferrochelatase
MERSGVLISNLGTPAAPTAAALRPYLREFLSDRRVVDVPRPIWWLVLNAFILPFRPGKVAHAYKEIWTEQGSPLLVIGLAQRDGLRANLGEEIPVELGMRYGQPSIAGALDALIEAGCTRVLHLPLYPQYAGATVATNHDAFFAAVSRGRSMVEARTVISYDTERTYIEALANSVREVWERDGEPERLLMSFHGIPQRYADEGDPYPCHCEGTAIRLASALGLPEERWQLTYQSRFGREPWLQPYTDETLEAWGKDGLGSVDVICPGFSADCLETLEEIDMQNREIFEEAGGGQFRYIPALNARDDHIAALEAVVRRHLSGWVD